MTESTRRTQLHVDSRNRADPNVDYTSCLNWLIEELDELRTEMVAFDEWTAEDDPHHIRMPEIQRRLQMEFYDVCGLMAKLAKHVDMCTDDTHSRQTAADVAFDFAKKNLDRKRKPIDFTRITMTFAVMDVEQHQCRKGSL